MSAIKNTLTVLMIILLTTAVNAQVETDKKKSEDDTEKSTWDNILNIGKEGYESTYLGECISGDCEDGYGIRRLANSTFEGNYKDGQLSGKGTYIEVNSSIAVALDGYAKLKYVGNWKQNKKHGLGVETRYDTDDKIIYKYEGSWDNDMKNGAGKEYVDGVLAYEGKFNNNFRFKDSGCITGDCENGYGVFIYPNKNKYIGEFKNSLKNGFGIETDPEGNYIYGNWKDNKENGLVRVFNKNNEIMFSGEMVSGKPVQKLADNGEEYGCKIGDCANGFGHYYFESGAKYIGEWKNGIQQGYGKTVWPDGTYYIGQQYEGNIDGYGTVYDATGKIIQTGKYVTGTYAGEAYRTDVSGNCEFGNCGYGFGIFIVELESEWKRGYEEVKNDFESKYEGMWVSEFKNEIGFFEDKDGNTYVGQFKADEYEGQGVATFANGDQYNGSFDGGTMTGFGTMTYANGSKYVGEWSYNDKEGTGKEYDKTGKLIYSGDFYNNERDE